MAVLIEIARFVAFMRMMGSRLLYLGRNSLVLVTMRIEVAGDVPLVRMMRARLFGGLGGHVFSPVS